MNVLEAFLGGLAVRTVRVLLDAAPYLLLGLATSGLLRAAVGPARLRRFFGDGRWSGPFRAWLAATALPVCALGVLPVLWELRRSGVRRGVVLTFALAAPMFNPVTLLSASSHMDLGLLVGLLTASAAAAILAGAALSGEGDPLESNPIEEASPPAGRARGAAAAVHALREASGPAWVDIGAGLAAAALISALVEPAYLSEGTFAGDPWAVVRMAAVATPAYLSPEVGVTALPEMVKFRQAAGAMLALIILGSGLTAGHLTWTARAYGRSTALRFLIVTVAATFAGAWVLDSTASPVGAMNPDNDHYEVLVSPIAPEHPAMTFHALRETLGRSDGAVMIAPAVLATMVVLGFVLRSGRLGPKSRFEDWTATDSEGVFDRRLPPWFVRAFSGSVVLTALAIGACVAFPSPEEAFQDMMVLKADFHGELGAEDLAVPLHHLTLWERSAGRLPVGAALRLRFPNAEARRLTNELTTALQSVRTATVAGDRDSARSRFHEVQAVYNQCRKAYDVD